MAKRGGSRAAVGTIDVFGGEVRRRDVVPMLVLHLLSRQPDYGNRLIEEIESITGGVLSVNPNTIYPLLRELERRGMIAGRWEHADRRSRRYYAITAAGRREYRRLVDELEPFLDSVVSSVTLIKQEIYQGRQPRKQRARAPKAPASGGDGDGDGRR
jgi:PadR family transcriptional regulator